MSDSEMYHLILPAQPDLAYDATDVDDGARTAAGHEGLGCSLSD